MSPRSFNRWTQTLRHDEGDLVSVRLRLAEPQRRAVIRDLGRTITLGGLVPNVEPAVFGPFLAEGYTVIVPDTEGQRADFAAGPEYGMNTLDSIRAAFNSSTIPNDAKVAMLGYSGGAIATEWAAELAPTYAPDASTRLIGAAMGGVLVDPAHNLHYVEGSGIWAGVMAMALAGIARAFEIEITAVPQRPRREDL